MAARRTRTLVGAVALSAVATLTACSRVVDGRPIPVSAPTRADLAKVVLTASDLPSGWTPLSRTAAGSDPDLEAHLATCLKVRFDNSLRVATARSADFHKDSDEVGSAAVSFSSQAEADIRIAAIRKPGAGSCFAAALREELAGGLPKDTAISDVSVRVLDGGVVVGVTATVHAVITFSALSQSARIWIDIAYIKARQSVATIAFTGVSGQVGADVQSRLTAGVVARARQA